MPSGHIIATQRRLGVINEFFPLHITVAFHAGVGRYSRFVRLIIVIHHIMMKLRPQIDGVKLAAEALANPPCVHQRIITATARPVKRPGCKPHHLVPRLNQQVRHQIAVYPTAHTYSNALGRGGQPIGKRRRHGGERLSKQRGSENQANKVSTIVSKKKPSCQMYFCISSQGRHVDIFYPIAAFKGNKETRLRLHRFFESLVTYYHMP
jgi:hypothetical protein